ncbi:glycosyltransferase family 92 protein Os08g0121900 [Sesamum indicum]|uniref:Glycosyltransferase family 92 protein n=1 Tax=Sesamum indicum TaxID=4182 RepID=A0A6I9T210_SESIN|nr:glycosyltransferase family 92 protein Os08g0121900 [Sesamum indicum]
MACQVRTPFLYVVASIAFCLVFYHHYLRHAIASSSLQLSPSATSNYVITHTLTTPSIAVAPAPAPAPSYAIRENLPAAAPPNYAIIDNLTAVHYVNSPPPLPPSPISTTSILLPGWEVFVIVPRRENSSDPNGDFCVFENNEVSPAKYFGRLPFPDRATFICPLPLHARRRLPFKQPLLTKSPMHPPETNGFSWPLLSQWSHLVYDSLTTNDDVVLFVKGVNIHQGTNRKPSELRCVFGDDASNGVRTAVTTSMQEVFRCPRPEQTAVPPVGGEAEPIKVSLEIVTENKVVPSVAYYTPPRRLESKKGKSLLCANTMVNNVAKFLREWVIYHSKIGVEKFLLYDNGSDDDLQQVVEELVKEGFDIITYFWAWPKTQEAGFSHAAIYAKEVCTWIIYIDVDEFVYRSSWDNLPKPSTSLLQSLLARNSSKLGQLSINCREFGPSEQRVHPVMGVTQGYHCRRRHHNRHKSIVLLDAIDDSLLNVVHHFRLRRGYKTKRFVSNHIVVNHYKYQAWPEFRAKFRRRVSAYVLDWTQKLNPKSHDRAPGLGFSAVEPDGWAQKFCEVHDHGLKDLARKWFGMESGSGYKMAWQR